MGNRYKSEVLAAPPDLTYVQRKAIEKTARQDEAKRAISALG